MQQVDEYDSCLECEVEREAAAKRPGRCDAILTRCLELGMFLMYATAFLGLIF